MKLKIPETYINILKKLNLNGFEAYIVGGCVRDLLLGITPNDYDITTSATPEQIKSIFEKTIDTGIKHGTITVMENGAATEVTTFRTETGYSDMRRPDSVEFVSDIKLDLSRRDFTVNAICYNPDTGIVDCFDSIKDLKNITLRAVGEPGQRFKEDALRIMRLFRFSSTLGFRIEKETYNAAINLSYLLENISRERIAAELKKAIMGKKTENFQPLINCEALKFCGINKGLLNKLSTLEQRLELRLYAFLKLTSNDLPYTLDELKMSNSHKEYCADMEYLYFNLKSSSPKEIKEILNCVDISVISDFVQYKRVIEDTDIGEVLITAKDIIASNEPYKTAHLDITGEDLKSLGLSGRQIGQSLEFLRKKVIADKSLNTKKTLIKIIENKRN